MRRALLTLLFASALGGVCVADTPAPTTAPAPPVSATDDANCTYCGLLTLDAPVAIDVQLGLPVGLGVMVLSVDADSPAAQAGLAAHDLITRLDDQMIVNPPQFSVLVRMRHPGETVKLEIVRHGKAITLPVRLGAKALPPPDDDVAALHLPPGVGPQISNIVAFDDGDHVITIVTRGNDRHVHVADHTGDVQFDGPLNSPADQQKLPPDVREKVQSIEQNWRRYQQLRGTSLAGTTAPSR